MEMITLDKVGAYLRDSGNLFHSDVAENKKTFVTKITFLSQNTLITFEKPKVITFLDKLEQSEMRDRREQGH